MPEEDTEKREVEEASENEETQQVENDEENQSRTVTLSVNTVILGAFILGLAVGFAGGSFVSQGESLLGQEAAAPSGNNNADNQPSDTGNQQNQDNKVSVADLSLKGEPVLGQEDAPLTMVMWEDFECPFCKRFEENTFPQIKKNFVDTGKVKVVWKDFPLPDRIHPWANEAAYAMECVYREGGNDAFWTVKNKVFANQNTISTSNVNSKIKTWASQEGVSNSSVQSCIDSGVSNEVKQDRDEGQNRGISGTPGFLVYKSNSDEATKLIGAQPYSRFEEEFNNKLN